MAANTSITQTSGAISFSEIKAAYTNTSTDTNTNTNTILYYIILY